MTKDEFYRGKSVVRIEWWLEDYFLPELVWARLRVFDDGTSDVCFGEGSTLYGLANEYSAEFFLTEEEYVTVEGMDEEDEREYGIKVAAIVPPSWSDQPEQPFKYRGAYPQPEPRP